MNLTQLRVFDMVIRTGSVTAATTATIHQPAWAMRAASPISNSSLRGPMVGKSTFSSAIEATTARSSTK